jgi:hypothetical protein
VSETEVRERPNPLLQPLSPEQHTAIEVIAQPYLTRDLWPVFQYVEGTLDERHGIDAATTLASLPTVGNYGLVWPWFQGSMRRPEETVGLTIAGLERVPRASSVVAVFVQLLGYLTDRQKHMRLLPEAVQEDLATSDEVLGALPPVGFVTPQFVYDLMEHEPATWRGSRSVNQDGSWTCCVERELRHYRDVSNVEEYLDRVALRLSPAPVAPSPVYTSPLGLLATIDYLDAIWRLATKKSLFVLPGAIATLKLGLECTTEEEFDSRLSAVASLLSAMKVPPLADAKSNKLGTLERLRIYLGSERPVTGVDRVERAIATLKSIVRVRVGAQHPNTRGEAAAAFKSLSLDFPPSDWGAAWMTIQARAVEALDAIREEVEEMVPRA